MLLCFYLKKSIIQLNKMFVLSFLLGGNSKLLVTLCSSLCPCAITIYSSEIWINPVCSPHRVHVIALNCCRSYSLGFTLTISRQFFSCPPLPVLLERLLHFPVGSIIYLRDFIRWGRISVGQKLNFPTHHTPLIVGCNVMSLHVGIVSFFVSPL